MAGLYIVRGTEWNIGQVELDLAVIVSGDGSLSFDSGAAFGVNVTLDPPSPADFARERIAAMGSDITQSPDILIYGAPSSLTVDGHKICDVGGATWTVGFMPGSVDINVAYDTGNCNGNGSYVFGKSGKIDAPTYTTLFHELMHAYHIMIGDEPSQVAQVEELTKQDENILRTAQGLPLRDVTNPLGGCNKPCKSPNGKGLAKWCLIVSAASGSPRSTEVFRFQQIRDRFRQTDLGQAFFEAFFREYYQFSPRVSSEMDGAPDFKQSVYDFFVEPLLGFYTIFRRVAAHPGRLAEERTTMNGAVTAYASVVARRGLSRGYVSLIANRLARVVETPGPRDLPDPTLVADFDQTLNRLLNAILECSAEPKITRWALLDSLAIFWEWVGCAMDSARGLSTVELENSVLDWLSRIPAGFALEDLNPAAIRHSLALLSETEIRNSRVMERIARKVLAGTDPVRQEGI